MNLPDRPSIDHLRRQARDLQKETGSKLASAQRELAKRYGFRDWTALRAHVLGTRLEAAVSDALGGRVTPDLSGDHPALRALMGEVADLDPLKPLAPRDWPPLLYAVFSRVSTPEKRRETARDLLSRGADPNSSWIHPEYPDPPQTPVAAAVAIHRDVELLRILLDAGANPTDGEGMYHGTEEPGQACLRLLIERGGSPRGFNALARMLDRHDPEGIKFLVDNYGEPDEDFHNALHHALVRGRDAEHLRILVDAGADPGFVRYGTDVATHARLVGLGDVGLPFATLTPAQAFLVACVEGTPADPVEIPAELGWVASEAAGRDHLGALTRMLDAGMDVDSRGDGGRTAACQAGWKGAPRTLALLVERGADLTLRDEHYGGTTLNWTVAGASWGQNEHGDYPTCIRLLRSLDAPHDEPWLRSLVENKPELAKIVFPEDTI